MLPLRTTNIYMEKGKNTVKFACRAHPAISHLLLKCRVATNITHRLKVQSNVVQKLHTVVIKRVDCICETVYFQILPLLFLHTVLMCHILLFGCWIFSLPSWCQTLWLQTRPDILSGLIWIQLFAKVISRQQKLPPSR